MMRTLEVWVAVPVVLACAIYLGTAIKVAVAGVVVEIAELIPQDSVNVLRTVADVDIFEQSLSENTHAVGEGERLHF
jgi:hypothetical protein